MKIPRAQVLPTAQRSPVRAAWNADPGQGVAYFTETSMPTGLTVLTQQNTSMTPATYSSASTIAPQITSYSVTEGSSK